MLWTQTGLDWTTWGKLAFSSLSHTFSLDAHQGEHRNAPIIASEPTRLHTPHERTDSEMVQRRFEIDVPQWREVLLLRATFTLFFLTACGRWALAAAGIDIRRGIYLYRFPNKTYATRGFFAYPQPSTGPNFGIAQVDGQAGTVQSLLATSLVLGFLDLDSILLPGAAQGQPRLD